jgi:hypothetical protein
MYMCVYATHTHTHNPGLLTFFEESHKAASGKTEFYIHPSIHPPIHKGGGWGSGTGKGRVGLGYLVLGFSWGGKTHTHTNPTPLFGFIVKFNFSLFAPCSC